LAQLPPTISRSYPSSRACLAAEITGTPATNSDATLKANLALARLCAGDLSGAETAIDAALKDNPRDEISITLKRLIAQVKRGERKQPKTPADLQE
jgi:hypothetical protein